MKIVILLGAPGSGKGTVASRLAASDSTFRHVSSGDLLRDAVSRKTNAGTEAESYMKRGELVPDILIATMIGDLAGELSKDCTLLLDGFPRTVPQAAILDTIVKDCGADLASVVLLDVEDSILIDRIAGRRTCPKCGKGYHVTSIPSRKEGVCDVCGTGLIIRKDDAPETVRYRLSVYQEQTVPLIALYVERGLLRKVNGVGPIGEMVERVRQAMA